MNKRAFGSIFTVAMISFFVTLAFTAGALRDHLSDIYGIRLNIKDFLSEMIVPLAVIVIALTVLSVVLAVRFSKNVIEPLQQREKECIPDSCDGLKPLIEHNEQLRREFTANVSHEMKTPLQSISGYAELLKSGIVQGEKVEEFSGRIYAESQRMITLIEDVLELSRLDEGGQGMERSEVDVYETVRQVVDSLDSKAREAGVHLKATGSSAVISGYPQLIFLIAYNLCENGIKYNVPGGSVDITVYRSEGDVVLSVSDTGVGIPGDQQERVFERFYRVDKSRSKEVGGTGLGLSIVKHAVQMHSADISLTSEQGAGTKVVVRFKAKRSDEQERELV